MRKSNSSYQTNMSKPKSKIYFDAAYRLHHSHIEFLPLEEGAQQPKQADSYCIGHDLIVPQDIRVPAHSRFYVPMGFAIGLPKYIEAKIEPRSGFSGKGIEGYGEKWVWEKLWGFLPIPHKESGKLRFDCDVLVGKIDPGYKNAINVIISNHDVSFVIPKGTKLAQMTFYRVQAVSIDVVDELHGFNRGGGLGHTGSRVQTGL